MKTRVFQLNNNNNNNNHKKKRKTRRKREAGEESTNLERGETWASMP